MFQDAGEFPTEQRVIRRNQMLNPYIEAWQLHDLIEKKEVKLREVAEFFSLRIEKLNPKLGAFMTATPERAMADVARLEKATADEIAKMPLYGIPYSLKDLTWTKDIKTTMGRKTTRTTCRRSMRR
jgi:aspartyl-tRNA(Asn)/glutamyl-tRNA(Gln) amidotransferase subunit A